MKRWTIDGLIIALVTVGVVAYMALTYTTSYQHIYILGLRTGQAGTDARLTPLTIDLPLLVLSLAVLFAARKGVSLKWYHGLNLSLWAGVLATVGANWYFGDHWGIVGALMSAVPAGFLAVVIETAMFVLRIAAESAETPSVEEAQEALKAAQEAARREMYRARGQRAAATRRARSALLGASTEVPENDPQEDFPPAPQRAGLTGIGLANY